MEKENVVIYTVKYIYTMWYIYTAQGLKKNDILKFASKWIEKDILSPDPERQTQYVLTHKWMLDIKQRITNL